MQTAAALFAIKKIKNEKTGKLLREIIGSVVEMP